MPGVTGTVAKGEGRRNPGEGAPPPARGPLEEIERRLRGLYGSPRHFNPNDPLSDLVFVVLSRMTQETKYLRAYRRVLAEFQSWDRVAEVPEGTVADLIRDAGLAPTKARHIKAILETVIQREGHADLSGLADQPDSVVESYLTSLPGVSRKTARCVMLYSLGRSVCPIDTHVWRVMQRLGFAAEGGWSERRAADLEEAIPVSLRASLHVTLIAHGRAICRARVPRCAECLLSDLCPSARLASAEESPSASIQSQ